MQVHAETLLFPVSGVLLPFGHVVHVVAATSLEYVPALQFVQDVVLVDCLYVPIPQLRHGFPFIPE